MNLTFPQVLAIFTICSTIIGGSQYVSHVSTRSQLNDFADSIEVKTIKQLNIEVDRINRRIDNSNSLYTYTELDSAMRGYFLVGFKDLKFLMSEVNKQNRNLLLHSLDSISRVMSDKEASIEVVYFESAKMEKSKRVKMFVDDTTMFYKEFLLSKFPFEKNE